MQVHGEYFYGNKISEYGIENGYVDYRTLAKAFNAVMCNDIISTTSGAGLGEWEPVSSNEIYYEDTDGSRYDYDDARELIDDYSAELDELEDIDEPDEETAARIDELRERIDALEDEKYYDVFQWYIVDNNGADILTKAGEIVYYNDALGLYIWGVTHWGTSWDYVLTNIRCNTGNDESEEG